jgi:hypothetical protein
VRKNINASHVVFGGQATKHEQASLVFLEHQADTSMNGMLVEFFTLMSTE